MSKMSKHRTFDSILDDFIKGTARSERHLKSYYDKIGHKCLEFIKKYENEQKQAPYKPVTARTESK